MSGIAKKISKFTKREIDYLFQYARRIFKSQICTILIAPRQKEFARILIVASSKVGNAPERNLVRRRIKSIFYQEKLFNFDCDCVIIVYKQAITFSFDELKNLLISTFQKHCQKNENSVF